MEYHFWFLNLLQEISIAKWYYICSVDNQVEHYFLHEFSNSSLVAYGGGIYLKLVPTCSIYVKLVTTKSIVDEKMKKSDSIPRLGLFVNSYQSGNLSLSRE